MSANVWERLLVFCDEFWCAIGQMGSFHNKLFSASTYILYVSSGDFHQQEAVIESIKKYTDLPEICAHGLHLLCFIVVR